MKKIRLQPFVSRGEPIVRADGKVEMVPVQLWRSKRGGAILRIGHTTFQFNKDGSYDGTEHAFHGDRTAEEKASFEALLEQSQTNRGFAPELPYYSPGSLGFKDESRGWVEATPESSGAVGPSRTYTIDEYGFPDADEPIDPTKH